MPDIGTLGWAYISGSNVTAKPKDKQVCFFSGSTVISGSDNFTYDHANDVVSLSGTLDVSGTIKAYEFNTITISNTEHLGSTSFGNSTGDTHQFTGSVLVSGATNALLVENGRVGIGILHPDSMLEILGTSTQLKLSNNLSDYATFAVGTHGDLAITTVDAAAAAANIQVTADGTAELAGTTVTLDSGGDIVLSADGDNITMDDGTTTIFDFDVADPAFKIMDDAQVANYCSIAVGANGETTITTVDTDAAIAHLNFVVDGDIVLGPAGGDVLPDADNTRNFGSASKRWANVYTGDLHLKNDRGDWTILEEEDYLCVVNNRTGKKYEMMLKEIKD